MIDIKTKSTETIVQEHEYVAERKCDICKKKCPYPEEADWDADTFYFQDKTRIYRISGGCYDDTDTRQMELFDICPDCWKSKLIPWFESHGAKPKTVRYEDQSFVKGQYD